MTSLWLVACLFASPMVEGESVAEPGALRVHAANESKRSRLAAIDHKLRNSMNPFFGELWIPRMRAERAKLPAGAPLEALWQIDLTLADCLLREGHVEDAIAVLNELVEACRRSPNAGPEQGILLAKKLATAHFRRAEQANCVCRRGGESCIFPLRDSGRHADRSGATEAAKVLEQGLAMHPGDLQAIWLLNLAHMALGSHPDGVPLLFRIPPERFESEHDIGRFEDIAARIGMTGRTCAGGASMDDFDGDGDLDVIVSSMNLSSPMAYYENNGDGSFTEVGAQKGLDAQSGALSFTHADVDGDGRLDLYVPRGAWMETDGEIPHSLLHQQPDGTFLDVTTAWGLEVSAPSQVAAFADVDNDGDLDLFVGMESTPTRTSWKHPSRLYRNDGGGRFVDVAQTAGVRNLAYCKGAAFGDYDGDGFVDLYVSNLFGPNRLYRNRGDFTFVDVAMELGVAEPIESFATWWFDANNDGWLDLLVTNYSGLGRASEVAAYYKNRTTGTDSTRIYINLGGKGFRDASAEMGLKRAFFPMGANFGDYDNDGFPDLYFGTGEPDFASLWPNLALRNDAGRRFQDVTTSGGLGHLQKGHGVAFGDIDQDGDQDLLVQMGGAFRDDAFYDALFRNPGHGRHWLTVRLRGTESNRFGVGARIRVRIAERGRERDVFTWVGTGGSFGNNSLQAEIGLGDADSIVSLEVTWPSGGRVERFEKVPLDGVIAITEGEGTFALVPMQPMKL